MDLALTYVPNLSSFVEEEAIYDEVIYDENNFTCVETKNPGEEICTSNSPIEIGLAEPYVDINIRGESVSFESTRGIQKDWCSK